MCKLCTVPYTLKDNVELELDILECVGIIEPVQSTDWAVPIISFIKHGGTLYICGDDKVTINQLAKVDTVFS